MWDVRELTFLINILPTKQTRTIVDQMDRAIQKGYHNESNSLFFFKSSSYDYFHEYLLLSINFMIYPFKWHVFDIVEDIEYGIIFASWIYYS